MHGIAHSRCFILVLSQAANTSKFVRREVEQADRKHKRIYTLRIQEVDPSDSLQLFVSETQWIDAVAGDLSTRAARPAYTRTGFDWTGRYPGVVSPAARLHCRSAILDGEVIVPMRRVTNRFGSDSAGRLGS